MLRHYGDLLKQPGEPMHAQLSDLLADLMHWAKRDGVGFDRLLSTAEMNFNEEDAEDA